MIERITIIGAGSTGHAVAGVMSMRDFMKYNLIKMGLTLALFWVLVLPFWYVMGLI